MVKPHPPCSTDSDASAGQQNSEGPQTEPLGGGMGFHRPLPGFLGEQVAPTLPPHPRQATGPTPIANKNLLARTPLGRAGLSQGAGLLGSRPTGRERKGLLEDAAPHTQSPTRPGRQNRRAGSLPSHAEQKAAGAWLCRPRSRWAVGRGRGGRTRSLGKGGDPRQPREGRPASWTGDPSPDSRREGPPGPGRGAKCPGEEARGCSRLKGKR